MENNQHNEVVEQNLNVLRTQFPNATWGFGGVDHGSAIYTCSNGKAGEEHQTFPVFAPQDRVIDPESETGKTILKDLSVTVAQLLNPDEIVDYHFSIG